MGAGPACCTCVRMLAAPPAAAMTYVKPSSGLEPSVYGGGGSPSSRSLLDVPLLVSRGSAALVSATTVEGAACCCSVSGNGNGGAGPAGAVAVRGAVAHAVVRGYGCSGDGSGKYCAGKPCEENGGGLSAAEVEDGSRSRSRSCCCSCGRSCASTSTSATAAAAAAAASRWKHESTSTLERGARPRREGVV